MFCSVPGLEGQACMVSGQMAQEWSSSALILLWLVMGAGLEQWDKSWPLPWLGLGTDWALLQHS